MDKVPGVDHHIRPLPVQLVGLLAQRLLEDLHGRGYQVRVSDPRPIEPVARFPQLVVPHLRQRHLVDFGVLAAGDEGGHASDGESPPPVARLDQQLRVGPHKGDGHGHLRPVREDQVRPITELLDDAEDVVPAARVQPGRMVPELI